VGDHLRRVVDPGLAKSGGKEWETFGVDAAAACDEVREAMHMIPRMWTEPEFSWNSPIYTMPPRCVIPKPLQKPHPRLWQTCGSPESFFMAGEMGVGALGTTLLSPIAFLGQMMREHDRGLAACPQPAGLTVNPEKGAFTFVHVAESRDEAIASGAALSALWYVNTAAVSFKVPRRVWYDMIKAGLHPNSARDTAALAELDPHETAIEPDDPPVLVVLKRRCWTSSNGSNPKRPSTRSRPPPSRGSPPSGPAMSRGASRGAGQRIPHDDARGLGRQCCGRHPGGRRGLRSQRQRH